MPYAKLQNFQKTGIATAPTARLGKVTARIFTGASSKATEKKLLGIIEKNGGKLVSKEPDSKESKIILYRLSSLTNTSLNFIALEEEIELYQGFPRTTSVESPINRQAARMANISSARSFFDLDGRNTTIGVMEPGCPQVEKGYLSKKLVHGDSLNQEVVKKLAKGLKDPICSKINGEKFPILYNSCHATHVIGTLAANKNAKEASGIAQGAGILVRSFSSGYNLNKSLLSKQFKLTDVNNHSYGLKDFLPLAGKYHKWSETIDRSAFNGSSLNVVAAGNNRREHIKSPYGISKNGLHFGTVSGAGVAKNALTVGSLRDYSIDTNETVYFSKRQKLSVFSDVGPTNDGRIKPEVMANGEWLYSPGISIGNDPRKAIYRSAGTSMATPVVTGAAALLQQLSERHRKRKLNANELKTVLIHGACTAKSRIYGKVICKGGNVPPSYDAGFGEIDAIASACAVASKYGDLREMLIPKGGRIKINFTRKVKDTDKPECEPKEIIAATIGWIDDVGLGLRQDIDFWIQTHEGSKKILPWSLNPSSPEKLAKRSINLLDNVEKITFPASRLNQVSHFSLVIDAKKASRAVKVALAWSGPFVATYP